MGITHPSLAGFTWWCEERESIRRKKEALWPHPLTDDKIMQSYRFCNVYRTDDAVSRWLKENIWNHLRPSWTLLANCVVHRMVSRLDTCKYIGWVEDGKSLMRKFHKRKKDGFAWGTASFHTVPSEKRWKALSDYVFNPAKMEALLLDFYENGEATCERMYALLLEVPSVGPFFAWQITADLIETEILKNAPDRYMYAVPGPGASEGLRQLGLTPDLEGIKNVMRYHNAHSKVKLDVKDTQHCLCEYSKYDYTLAGRAHPRIRYNPNQPYGK